MQLEYSIFYQAPSRLQFEFCLWCSFYLWTIKQLKKKKRTNENKSILFSFVRLFLKVFLIKQKLESHNKKFKMKSRWRPLKDGISTCYECLRTPNYQATFLPITMFSKLFKIFLWAFFFDGQLITKKCVEDLWKDIYNWCGFHY